MITNKLKFRAQKNYNDEIVFFDLQNWLESNEEDMPKCIEYQLKNISRFTGFKDYDGKEIYEGDIISFTTVRDGTQKKRFEIYFDLLCGSWRCKNGQELSCILVQQNNDDWKRSQNWTIRDCQYIRVIGNIYQHSELLI